MRRRQSLALFMYQKPRAAKRLYFDVIPRAVDDYLTFVEKFPSQTPAQRLENPAWHIHNGKPPVTAPGVPRTPDLRHPAQPRHRSCNAEAKDTLWGFIAAICPRRRRDRAPFLDKMVGYAINYYRDHVKPTRKNTAPPTTCERTALAELLAASRQRHRPGRRADDLQNEVFEIGKRHPFPGTAPLVVQGALRSAAGPGQGPRMGSFIALYGRKEIGRPSSARS